MNQVNYGGGFVNANPSCSVPEPIGVKLETRELDEQMTDSSRRRNPENLDVDRSLGYGRGQGDDHDDNEHGNEGDAPPTGKWIHGEYWWTNSTSI